MSNEVSPSRKRMRLQLAFKDRTEGLILNLQNVYYLPNSLYNLVSLGLLNDSRIYHQNENKTLHQVKSKQTLTQA